MEKRLGITKHRKNLPLHERMESIRQNIEEGKRKQEEMKEVRRLQEEGKKEEVDNNKIASMATDLMIKEDLSYIDALEKAKKLYTEEVSKENE